MLEQATDQPTTLTSTMTTLIEQLRRIREPRLLVLGDLMLDRYTWGSAQRVSPEAPVLVLAADREEVRLGGAASVAGLLRGLKAEAVLAGVVGNDPAGRIAYRLFEESGIDSRLVLVDAGRPTTTKERFIGKAANKHAHQILRVDKESCSPIDTDQEARLAAAIRLELADCHAVLMSDYAKGVCTPKLLQAVIHAAHEASVPVLIDPARGADYRKYSKASLIKPNRFEAGEAWKAPITSPQEALAAGEFLCREFNLGAAVVTLDQEGMALAAPGKSGVLFRTKARSVYDITGAGDMALAMLGLCQASELDLKISVELANVAAGLQVERLGVEQVTRNEFLDAIIHEQAVSGNQKRGKLVTPADLPRLAAEYRHAGRRVVFTNGCFDLLHVGHVSYLQEAAALGDVLIVGINSDSSVHRIKGPTRPVIGEKDRAAMLAALACVSHVVIFEDATPHALLRALRPDVLVKGGTYTEQEVVGREVVDDYGGKVCVVGHIDGVSTTEILKSLTERQLVTKEHARELEAVQ